MKKPKKSKHLDVPSESNRDKHINFRAQEHGDVDPGADVFGNLFKKDDDNQVDDEDARES